MDNPPRSRSQADVAGRRAQNLQTRGQRQSPGKGMTAATGDRSNVCTSSLRTWMFLVSGGTAPGDDSHVEMSGSCTRRGGECSRVEATPTPANSSSGTSPPRRRPERWWNAFSMPKDRADGGRWTMRDHFPWGTSRRQPHRSRSWDPMPSSCRHAVPRPSNVGQ
jgi:hypothetical protein